MLLIEFKIINIIIYLMNYIQRMINSEKNITRINSRHFAIFIPTGTHEKISQGTNYLLHRHHINNKYSQRTTISLHAEISALYSLENKMHRMKPRNKTKLDLMVVRVDDNKNLLLSRPCKQCLESLRKASIVLQINIKTIFYSANDGTIHSEKFKEMINSPLNIISRGNR